MQCNGLGACMAIADGTDPDFECGSDEVCDGAGGCRAAVLPDMTVVADLARTSDLSGNGDLAEAFDLSGVALADLAGSAGSDDSGAIAEAGAPGDAGRSVVPGTSAGCHCDFGAARGGEGGGWLALMLVAGLLVRRRQDA